jgi:hypothetical protein
MTNKYSRWENAEFLNISAGSVRETVTGEVEAKTHHV